MLADQFPDPVTVVADVDRNKARLPAVLRGDLVEYVLLVNAAPPPVNQKLATSGRSK